MKSLRKIGRAHRLKTHDQIKAWLQPKLGSIGTKYRLAARIRLANAWARKHPKRTCACVVGTLSFLLAVTVTLDGMRPNDGQEPDISAIASMEPLFSFPYHTGEQGRTAADVAGTGRRRAGTPRGTGLHDSPAPQEPCGFRPHRPAVRETGKHCQITQKQR